MRALSSLLVVAALAALACAAVPALAVTESFSLRPNVPGEAAVAVALQSSDSRTALCRFTFAAAGGSSEQWELHGEHDAVNKLVTCKANVRPGRASYLLFSAFEVTAELDVDGQSEGKPLQSASGSAHAFSGVGEPLVEGKDFEVKKHSVVRGSESSGEIGEVAAAFQLPKARGKRVKAPRRTKSEL